MNDLWSFNLNTGVWTWVSGNNNLPPGRFGSKGFASTDNYPYPKKNGCAWFDSVANEFWLFGGWTVMGGGQGTGLLFLTFFP